MADSLFDILSSRDFTEPPEVAAIKQYVQEHFQVAVEVLINAHSIIVTTPSASLANTLRFHQIQLKKAAQTDKRIVLRIR